MKYNGYYTPVYISLFLGVITLGLSLFGECSLLPILILLLLVFVITIFSWIVTSVVTRLKYWALPISFASLIYVGINIMVLSTFEDISTFITWDIGMLGLGLSVMAFGFALFSETIMKRIDENVVKILTQIGDTIDTPEEPEAKAKFLKNLITTQPEEGKKQVDVHGKITIISRTEEETKKRLDEDTKKVGYQRGEIYKVDDDNWAIHWGGKYPL